MLVLALLARRLLDLQLWQRYIVRRLHVQIDKQTSICLDCLEDRVFDNEYIRVLSLDDNPLHTFVNSYSHPALQKLEKRNSLIVYL